MPRAPAPTTSRARKARKAATSVARKGYAEPNSDEDLEGQVDDRMDEWSDEAEVEVAVGGKGNKAGAKAVSSSYNPLGNLGESDDDQEG